MFRAAALRLLAVTLLQGTGLAASLAELSCEPEHHEDAGAPADCAPECADCACCVAVIPPPLAVSASFEAPVVRNLDHHERPQLVPPDPDPRGVLHVPLAAA